MSIHILTTEQLEELLRKQIKITAEFYSNDKIIQDEIMKSPLMSLPTAVEVPTDEEIEEQFFVDGISFGRKQRSRVYYLRNGAKWMRDKLLTPNQ